MTSHNRDILPVDAGTWSDGGSWELFLSTEQPDPRLCTAALAVCIIAKHGLVKPRVALTYNLGRAPGVGKKWETPSGHIDPTDETPRHAAMREAREETGFVARRARRDTEGLFAHMRIVNDPSSDFPPIAFFPCYWALTDKPLETPIDPGQPPDRIFTLEQMEEKVRQSEMRATELTIVRYGLEAALQAQGQKG